MNEGPNALPPRVPARLILNQEGVIAIVAMVGLWLRDGEVFAGLAANGGLFWSVVGGALVGGACSAGLWLLRGLAPLADLERWQRRMVEGWTPADVAAVAVFSGLAEEALVRALLLGLLLGWVGERIGYPAAAAAHIVLNSASLWRLRAAAA